MVGMFENPLVVLDSMLKRAGHERWGWHIYRCTYNSDDDWSEFMKQLRTISQQYLDDYGATDDAVAKQLTFTVVEDRDRLENADQERRAPHFQRLGQRPGSSCRTAKYEESLRSVLDDSRDWHVNIINRRWISEEEKEEEEEDSYGENYDEDQEDTDGAYLPPEIEGCTEEDVG
ncbi:hypothetical protein MBLNU13_g04716t1 [Cladosporium sp. NU13]